MNPGYGYTAPTRDVSTTTSFGAWTYSNSAAIGPAKMGMTFVSVTVTSRQSSAKAAIAQALNTNEAAITEITITGTIHMPVT